MADSDRSRAGAASAGDVVESPSRHRSDAAPTGGDDAAGVGEDVQASGRRAMQAGDEPSGPGGTAGAPRADAPAGAAREAGDDWVPL